MNLKSKLESILFVSLKPLSLNKLASICQVKPVEVEEALKSLANDYKERVSGISLLAVNDEYQLSTASNSSEIVKEYLKDETSSELSQPSLEALTIIAYRGPIAKSELDKIRGVNCSLIIRNLLLRGLIDESFDRKKVENIYSISHDFLRFLGLSSVEGLPDFEKLSKLEIVDRFLKEETEV